MGRQSVLDIIFRTKKTGQGEQQAQTGLKGLSNQFQALTGVSFGAAAAIGAVAGGLKWAIGEAMEAQKTGAQLNAVLESTKYAAGLSADEINEMATQMSRLTGIEDDTIINAASIMLTFTKIGQEIFPDATMAAMNMSTALGQDLTQSVIQVGKALNDPILGMTALRRVGVSFTEDQADMVKALVASGKMLEAQKFILQELQTEFGGVAEAMGDTLEGRINKAKNAFGELGEAVGEKLLPPLGDLAQLVADLLTLETDSWFEQGADASARFINSIFGLDKHTDDAIDTQTAYYISMGKLAQETRNAELATEGLEEATIDLEEAQKILKQALSDLQLFVSGPLGSEFETFKQSQDELSEKAKDLAAQIGELEHKKYLTSEQKDELAALREDLAETNEAISANADAHDEATKRIMFDLLTQRAALDGLTQDELRFLTEIAEGWGLVDEATANYVNAADQYFSMLSSTSSENLGAVRYELEQVLGLLNSLPTEKVITLYLEGKISTQAAAVMGASGAQIAKAIDDLSYGKQHGGDVNPYGLYRVGEGNQPELLQTPVGLFMIPGDRGEVFSNRDSRQILGGVTIGDIHIHTSGNASPEQIARQVVGEITSQMRMAGRAGTGIRGKNI